MIFVLLSSQSRHHQPGNLSSSTKLLQHLHYFRIPDIHSKLIVIFSNALDISGHSKCTFLLLNAANISCDNEWIVLFMNAIDISGHSRWIVFNIIKVYWQLIILNIRRRWREGSLPASPAPASPPRWNSSLSLLADPGYVIYPYATRTTFGRAIGPQFAIACINMLYFYTHQNERSPLPDYYL